MMHRFTLGVEGQAVLWDPAGIERMLGAASAIGDIPSRIAFISGHFLGVPYKESTLIGSPDTPEVLVITFQGVDCFTYLDYVEAMRLSASFEEFKHYLRLVRYRGGSVSYGARNHFFTDWAASSRVLDVTAMIGQGREEGVTRDLNLKDDGTYFLPAIPPVRRTFSVIPTERLDRDALSMLATGDYVGVYTKTEGLDVSHVGIIIRDEKRLLFRHASLVEKRVVDQEFRRYISGKPGIIVLRPMG
jgi:hypothetical protein